MSCDSPSGITELLRDWSNGDKDALGRLVPLVYADLKVLANRHLARLGQGQTLQPTALVHEAYLRLAAKGPVQWNDRVHFFAVVAHIMRGILVDHARMQHSAKRGGGAVTLALDETLALIDARDINLLALDETLSRLSALDSRQERIVELRFFGGLSIAEISWELGISPATVKRDWVLAKTWLRRELLSAADHSS
jgi:RNA polymerase sigma factor (TIGR02999 family)